MGQRCEALRSCQELADILLEAKETEDEARKTEIVEVLRSRVCNKRDRKVCCATTQTGKTNKHQEIAILTRSISFLSLDNKSCSVTIVLYQGTAPVKKIGNLVNFFHDISGEVFATDSRTVLIKGFTYDGEGPDTFFLAGTSGTPSGRGDVSVLPWPADGAEYDYSDRNIPLIKRSFDGSEDLVLRLPAGTSFQQLK